MDLKMQTQELEKLSTDLSNAIELSNIGDIGRAPNYSINTMRNVMQNQFPLLDWLRNTPLSVQMANAISNGSIMTRKDPDTGDIMVQLPISWGTKTPPMDNSACCWLPMDLAACGGQVPLKLLCLKDCDDMLNNMLNDVIKFQSNDMINYYMRAGESIKDARKRMAKESMAFYTAYTMLLGMLKATGGNILKPFSGLAEIMARATVIKINGSDILTAFEQVACRISVIEGGSYTFAAHPLIIEAVKNTIRPDKNGNLPFGWTNDGTNVSYNGIRLIGDKRVPLDKEKRTGDIWVLDANVLGEIMLTTLAPEDKFIKEAFSATDDPSKGCASDCTYYWNAGAVFSTNDNHLAVVTNVPISGYCSDVALQGLDNLINPETIVPM